MSIWRTHQQPWHTGLNGQGSDPTICYTGPVLPDWNRFPTHLATLQRAIGRPPTCGLRSVGLATHCTWKWGLETHLASCLNSGSMTLTNSEGSMTSRISSSSLRNITSLGLWVLGQYLSRAVTACRETKALGLDGLWVGCMDYGLDVAWHGGSIPNQKDCIWLFEPVTTIKYIYTVLATSF